MSPSLFLILTILVILVGFFIGRLLKEREGVMGRTMPEPLRHPGATALTVTPGQRGTYAAKGLNEWVDSLMNTYFDKDGYPFDDTRQAFLGKFVTPFPHSLVTPTTLSKLDDIGFYVMRQVLPQLSNLDQKKVSWPPIVWSKLPPAGQAAGSGGQDGGLYATIMSLASSAPSKSSATTDAAAATAPSPKSSSAAAAAGSGVAIKIDAPTTSCKVSDACGQPCPKSCIDAALQSLAPAPAPAVTSSPTNLTQFQSNLTSNELNEWWSLFTGDSTGDASQQRRPTSSSPTQPVNTRTPKIDHIEVTPTFDNQLDDFLNANYIDYFFDKVTGVPTQKFLDLYTAYTQGQASMDQFHMNKASDLIYYVLETLVAGLPTQFKPAFDFTWKRISRLSAREFVL